MKRQVRYLVVIMIFVAGLVPDAAAQGRNVSVAYLRAALNSLPDRGSVSFTAEYSGREGLKQASGSYLRNKGFSRFTVRDPETGLTFNSIYCEQGSAVFNELLKVTGTRRFNFQGHKGTGEGREDAIFVTSAEPVRLPRDERVEEEEEEEKTYRVTIVDHATSNRTVMVNVELGKEFNLMGATLLIEEEDSDPDGIRIME